MTEPSHMWRYYRERYGIKSALAECYPETLAADPQLQVALAQLQNAELVIDTIMMKKADENEDDPNT